MSLINRLGNRDKTEPYKQNRKPNRTVEFSTVPIPIVQEFLGRLRLQRRKTVQVNLDMTDSMGPGKLVCHMQNLSYTYDTYLICMGLGPSILSVIDKKSVLQWSVISNFTCISTMQGLVPVLDTIPNINIKLEKKYCIF